MGTYKNISYELRSFFNSHGVFKILMPLDIAILLTGLGVMVLNEFVGVGGLLYNIAYYLFLLGLLLTYASFNQKMLYIGFFTYGALQFINLIQGIFAKYSYINYHALLTALIFIWIGYLAFRSHAVSSKS